MTKAELIVATQRPRTKKMNCAQCGDEMRMLYPENAVSVLCQDCTMMMLCDDDE